MNSQQNSKDIKTDSAQTNVNQHGEEIKGWMTLTAHADVAERTLGSINIPRSRIVVARVQCVKGGPAARVFDLTVNNFHEYIADGLVVSNCIDSLRYSLEAVRRTIKSREVDIDNMVIEPRTNYWNKGR